MEFAKSLAAFMYKNGIIRFGSFTLASGRSSPYYVDMRLAAGYPVEFRRMIKHMEGAILEERGLDGFDLLASVPTGGLVIAAALAIETVKPLAYARGAPKKYGAGKTVEGVVRDGARTIMVDDVATTGGSIIRGVESLRDAGAVISDAYVMVDRMQGAAENLEKTGVRLHAMATIRDIAQELHRTGTIGGDLLDRI